MVDIRKVKINGEEFSECFASFYFCNSLEYSSKPERVIDGTLENDRVDRYYIPKAEFSFATLTPKQYSYLVMAINTAGCIIECYDYELMMMVRRFMCMAKVDRNKLIAVGGNLKLLHNTKFTMESKFAYLDYLDLETKATVDSRF